MCLFVVCGVFACVSVCNVLCVVFDVCMWFVCCLKCVSGVCVLL